MPMVYPSGAAWTTRPVAIVPLAVSTAIGWPRFFIPSATMRASVSVGPPGGKPTIMVSGCDGKSSACTEPADTKAKAAINAPANPARFMTLSPGVRVPQRVLFSRHDDMARGMLIGQQRCRDAIAAYRCKALASLLGKPLGAAIGASH